MRKPHIVQRVGKRPYPQGLITVQAACEQKYLSDSDDVGTLSLAGWFAEFGRFDQDNPVLLYRAGEPTAVQWWNALRTITAECTTCVIFSTFARETAAALGLWDCLENGKLTLTGADPFYKQAGDDSNAIRKDGYVILCGPPTVICFRDPDIDCTYTWLDVGNFGIGDVRKFLVKAAEYVKEPIRWETDPWLHPASLETQSSCTSIAVSAILRTIDDCELGGLDHTAGSLASNGFRHACMDDAIHIHDSKQVLDMERAALVGGRAEASFIGTVYQAGREGELFGSDIHPNGVRCDFGPIYHLDVNSLYPSVAIDAMLPTRLRAYTKHVNLKTAIAACKACCVVADCLIKTDRPIVPYRHAGITVWPVGEFATTLCGPEILLAHEQGTVLQVRELACYDGQTIYDSWVDRLYGYRVECRKDGMIARGDVAKAILNASFGKWAQLSRQWVDDNSFLPIAPYTQWYGERMPDGNREQMRAIAWQTQRLQVQGETPESFPAITAYINSLGRVRLWRLLQSAGLDNVLYYDTDSIWCNGTGYLALQCNDELDDNALGKMKLVGTHRKLRILGRQAYEADGKLHMSGYTEKLVRTNDAFAMGVSAPPIQHYLLKDAAPGLDRIVTRHRTNRPYQHGHVQEDGRVLPIRFDP